MFTTLPALPLISAMSGIMLLVVGVISLFSKTFSPRFSNDWRTPSHDRHHRTLDLREGLGCSLIKPSTGIRSPRW